MGKDRKKLEKLLREEYRKMIISHLSGSVLTRIFTQIFVEIKNF